MTVVYCSVHTRIETKDTLLLTETVLQPTTLWATLTNTYSVHVSAAVVVAALVVLRLKVVC